jgi:hypothetical protein
MASVRYVGTSSVGRERGVQAPGADLCGLATDVFFVTLDGCWIMRGHQRWEIEIFSVSVQDGWRWIQLCLVGDPTFVLTLRERIETSPSDVYTALTARLALLVSERSAPTVKLPPQKDRSGATAQAVS